MEFSFTNGTEAVPATALKLGYQDDSGDYYTAVANSEWGRIPGKSRDGKCWYSYNGGEHETEDFDLVTFPCTMTTVPNNGEGPPPGARPVGNQTDGRGDQYAAIANTEYGKVPGKACENTCWYPYGGAEHETEDFEWVACSRVCETHHEKMDVDFVQQAEPPENGLKFGFQNDGAGDLWVAVADTEWGRIPGKAKDGTCWYGYNGEEHTAESFSYLVYTSPHKLVANDDSGSPPEGAIPVGNQNDGRGDQWAAIANSEWGRIPGKAEGNTCWYPYAGAEHETHDFDWVVLSNEP